MKKKNSTKIFIAIIVTFVLFVFLYYKYTIYKPLQNKQAGVDMTTSSWKQYKNLEGKYSFKCPSDWEFDDMQVDYNAMIKIYKCTKAYEVTKYEFIDGIVLSVGFVPLDVEEKNKTYADNKVEVIKNQPDYQSYTINGFKTWVLMSGYNRSTKFSFTARKRTPEGYFEITASADGDTHTDQYYKDLVDSVIGSFQELNK